MRALIAIVVVVMAGLLLAAPTAGAQSGPESTAVVVDTGSRAAWEVPSAMSAGSGCKWVKGTVTYKSWLGFVLYKYWEKQSFCWNGRVITALWDYSRGPCCVDATWDWIGHTGKWRTGGVGHSGASVKTEGHFKQCIDPIPSCYNRYPWVIIRMDNSGAVIVNGHN